MKDQSIKTIMSDKLVTLHPKDKLQRAKDIFKTYDLHHIPIVVMNKVVGILSKGDILYLESIVTNSFDKFIQDHKFRIDSVEEVMTRDPYCKESSSSIADVLNLMISKRVNAVPITESGELIGLVTSFDFLKLVDKHFNE